MREISSTYSNRRFGTRFALLSAMAQNAGMELEVMPGTQSSSLVQRTVHSVPFVELRESLPSQVAIISPFVDQLMRFIARFRTEDGSELDIETALREALANAIVHGNQEDSHKRVYVACRCYSNGEVALTVRDQGQGFNCNAITNPTKQKNLLSAHGRGIYLMQAFMDEVGFEDGGSTVRMRKNSSSETAVPRRAE